MGLFMLVHILNICIVTLCSCFDFFETTIYFFKPNCILSQETILTFLSIASARE
jgi:hypothetical protein